MARQRTNLDTLWRQIEQAGSIDAYVDGQLREHGFLVERRATDKHVVPRTKEVQR